MTDTDKSPSEQAHDLMAKWNPPPTDNTLAYTIGQERHESDTRATVSTDYTEHNRGFVSPTDSGVDASRLSEFRDDLDDDEEDTALEDMSKKDLQKQAEARGLPKSGSKDDLIERIEEHDAEQAEASGDAEGESDDDEDDDDEE